MEGLEIVSEPAEFTVFGARGFIGRHLVQHLRSMGRTCFEPARDDNSVFQGDLGNIIYCVGLTADWRARPLDVVDAHVTGLERIIRRGRFSSLLYLSSTRIYKRAAVATEESVLSVQPNDPDDLFDLSKILGESICLSDPRPIRIARLSNVYGPDFRSENFLSSLIRDALKGLIVLRTSLDSAKDYISVEQVVSLLFNIAERGRQRLYNVASGNNTTHKAIVDALATYTGCRVDVLPNAPRTSFPRIAADRIVEEFGFTAGSLSADIPRIVESFRLSHLEEV
jgi:nucleoside-diphosphate-sugar epimerase